MELTYMTAVKSAQQSMNAGRYQAAVLKFEHAIEIDTTEPLAYVGLAETLLNQGNLQAALGAAREAVRHRPNFGRAQVGLARCLCQVAESCDSPEAKEDLMSEALTSYEKATALCAAIEPIPILDDWRNARLAEELNAQRIKNHEARVRRWEESRARYGLAFIPHGDVSEANQAILDHEGATEGGKRWRLEYYRAKRKY
ncbi:MAG: tetratricopeptide repeat protein [Capsulimonadaceae bacterium]